jgi:BirA family biotin operon repressor/biotin-[acetyl-CoA-carboxylase] ligase
MFVMSETASWSDAAVPGRRIGHSIESHAEIGSTSDRARAALDEPGGEGRAVVAELQLAGRGRRGRTWLSPPGVNLMVSVAFRPRLAGGRSWWIGAAASLAVLDAATGLADLRLKWPNDVVTAGGRKVAGLLLETELSGDELRAAVVGIGINVNWRVTEMPADLAGAATSLAELAGRTVDRIELLGRLLAALDREVALVESGISPLERYRAASAIDGRLVTVSVGTGRVEGIARGVDDDGSLVVDGADGPHRIAHGEVVRVRRPEEVTA